MIPEISVGKYGFEKILEDFKNTKNIVIVTYNISIKENELLSTLKKIKDKKIIIITNIPGRWEKYFDNSKESNKIGPKEQALQKIKVYLNALNPKSFKSEVEVYFNFKNHAKVYSTDNYTYIGSQNFSEESKNNYETGIILENNIGIEIMKEVRNDSIRYYELNIETLKKKLRNKIVELYTILIYIRRETESLPSKFNDVEEYIMIIDPYLYSIEINFKRLEKKIISLKEQIEFYKNKYCHYNLIFLELIMKLLLVAENKINRIAMNLNNVQINYYSNFIDESTLNLTEEISSEILNSMYNEIKKASEEEIRKICDEILISLNCKEFIEINSKIPRSEKLINNAE